MNLKELREEDIEYIDSIHPHKKLRVKDAMIKPIILHENDDIDIIIKKLKNEKHNYCIVVDDDENFIGEISVEKLIKLIAHNALDEPLVKILDIGFKRKINYTTAKDHIKKHKNFVYEDNSILDVLRIIDKKNLSYLPVFNSNQKVVGIITPSSLLNLLNKH